MWTAMLIVRPVTGEEPQPPPTHTALPSTPPNFGTHSLCFIPSPYVAMKIICPKHLESLVFLVKYPWKPEHD